MMMQCLFMSCTSFALSDEIVWLDSYEREVLGQMLLGLKGVTSNIDNILIKINTSFYNNPNHSRWFNVRKRMYNNQQQRHRGQQHVICICGSRVPWIPFMILLA